MTFIQAWFKFGLTCL